MNDQMINGDMMCVKEEMIFATNKVAVKRKVRIVNNFGSRYTLKHSLI